MIRVLVADDSAFMRKVLGDLFSRQPDFELVGTALNGRDAISKVKEQRPDLMTMDVNMPVMNGLDALAVIMKECPLPVVMLSSLTQEGTEATIQALSLGAVDFISKAGGSISSIDTIEEEILSKCRNAARAHVQPIVMAKEPPAALPVKKRIELSTRHGLRPPTTSKEPTSAHAVRLARRENPLLKKRSPLPDGMNKLNIIPAAGSETRPAGCRLVAVGTSTGGPQALQRVIVQLPADLPCGVVVVQHMPAGFTKALADRLNSISRIAVKEAEDGELIRPGHVYIAPGGYHLRVEARQTSMYICLGQDPPVGNHRPAVNVMYDSVASLGRQLVAVIMTGMGSDGCEGMKKIKAAGGYSIAQDEATCVVYGMPKVVVEAGLADEVCPVQDIARAIVKAVRR
ncbi:chemotaxis response regulator protein-glutamate methylesterase [Selenomonas sp. WCA-380-WT-3B 3/]|uniref:Protein-glutamate methylesterase/protein-glutamine glutaminase n=2 Tax=Selenomonas montiformis TaxID=2652285 RepID=A0A6I2UXN4_9FIRM|nr:chemotaxis response regulator protein-glutamate methylesterase [Selenomonas montiformis]